MNPDFLCFRINCNRSSASHHVVAIDRHVKNVHPNVSRACTGRLNAIHFDRGRFHFMVPYLFLNQVLDMSPQISPLQKYAAPSGNT
jgi:hypothetical protein